MDSRPRLAGLQRLWQDGVYCLGTDLLLLDGICVAVTSIRRFRNPDLPGLVRLWNEHFRIATGAHPLSAAVFEQAVLARTFFDPQQLRVADAGAGPIGFAHWMVPANQQTNQHTSAVVAAVCVAPGPEAAAIADQLLADCERAAAAEGHATLYAGGAPDQLSGYAGLQPLGPGEGIADDDLSAAQWLTSRGFLPHRRLGRYRLDVAAFRPPIDRPLMMLRRSTQTRSQMIQPSDWRSASALSHVQIERFFSSRSGANTAWADFWLSDPEALVLSGGTAILDQWRADDPANEQAAARLLIAVALQELAGRGLLYVEASAATDQVERGEVLRALRFQQCSQGTIYVKRL